MTTSVQESVSSNLQLDSPNQSYYPILQMENALDFGDWLESKTHRAMNQGS